MTPTDLAVKAAIEDFEKGTTMNTNEQSEREAFEAAAREEWDGKHVPDAAWIGWKLRAALASRQAVPGWREQAAGWLRQKADEQERINSECPAHAAAYPSWSDLARQLRWLAQDVLASSPAQPQQGETLAEKERDAIAALNHVQWAALGQAYALVAACHRLSAEAEEFHFDDGLRRGAQQAYWDEFESALERATEAMDTANKETQRLHAAQPPAAPALVPLTTVFLEAMEWGRDNWARFSMSGQDHREVAEQFAERAHGIGTAKPAQEGGA